MDWQKNGWGKYSLIDFDILLCTCAFTIFFEAFFMNLILHLFMNVLVLLIRKKYKIYIVQNASVCFSVGIEHTRSRQTYKMCRRQTDSRACSGSVVECLTRDRGAAGSRLTGVAALCH